MRRSILTILLLSASTFALALPARAQDVPPSEQEAAEAGEAASPGDDIIVTGTRAQGRTVANSPVPIDVISADAMTNTGYTETSKVLNQLVPSFNFPQPSITDGTDTVRPATLRGLSPDQTLVLVNGKRRHTTALLNINGSVGRGSAAVDLNMIPAIAIGRVEVLRDGAAAQYGSDAIAGVINFQLAEKRDFSGRVTVTHGYYDTRTDGVQQFASLVGPTTGAPTLAPDGTLAVNTTGRDRRITDGATTTVAATVGLPIGQEGFFDVSAEYNTRNPTNRTGFDPRQQYDLIGGSLDPREFTVNRYNHRYGDAKTQDLKLFINSGIGIGAATLYAFGSYNFRDGESAAFYRRPIAADGRNIAAIYPNGFLPLINTTLEDLSGTTGLKGEVGDGFRYDLSVSTAKNKFDFQIKDTLNRSFGPTSPTAFDAGGLRYTQTVANLDLSKEVELGGFDKVTLAAGGEYRRETFQLRPGTPASYQAGPVLGTAAGSQGFPGISPTIGGQRVDQLRSRHNFSAYGEVDVEVSDAFTLQGAGRYEDYSDFGSDWNYKVAGRFEPVRGFAVRGAVSSGFRAPSLQQQFFSASATNNVNGVLLETVTLPIDNPIAIALGATPLKAETSVSYSGGVVFTAIPRLSVTVDVYQVSIDDRIVVTDNLTATRTAAGVPSGTNPGLAIARILNNAGFANTNAARFFVNGVDTRTRGIDAVATYRLDVAAGRLNLTAGFNYNKTKIERVLAAPGPLANIPGLVLFGRQESLRLTDGQPRTKINLSADYDRDWIGFNVRTNRYGRTLGAGVDQFGDVALRAKWITDAELRGNFDRFELAIGANNVFDVYPTATPVGRGVDPITGAARNYGATNYVTPYSSFSPFGFNGRYLYARAGVKF